MKECAHKTVIDKFLYGKCLECRREKGRRNYQRHKKIVLRKCADYRKLNPEKVKEAKKRYYEKTRHLKFMKKQQRQLSKEELQYVTKLKNIIYTVNQLQRRYNKYRRLAKYSIIAD
jgi:hypothetical protein